ncbi:MAG TPA: cytochrome c-type biogenesis protein CcmH [Actinomycetota bacterium]
MKRRQGVKAGRIALAGLVMAAAAAIVISARGPDPDATPTAEAVENRVMSAWCPGLTLAECPSNQAAALRQKIAAHVAERWSNRRIDAWLVDSYGEAVLGRPRSATAFLVPLAAVAGGALVVAFVLRRRPPPEPSLPSAQPAPGGGPGPAPGGGAGDQGEQGDRGEQTGAWHARLETDLRRFAGEVTE